ncbi:MAG TPA: glycine--tRNA ligase subunit beta [Acetobacteraceae bacterium]|nr:glycine--tRNA ligase subunit beta [Acetobacteraceae bacterium]
MPELFLELFSEEIPARMQAAAAADLARLLGAALAPLAPGGIATFHGPRRIALRADVAAAVAAASSTERGPRLAAPEQAVAGFLRKHGADRAQLRAEGDYWVLEKRAEAVSAAVLIAGALPPLLRRFPWPKSMRWGGTSAFTWVRPLRRIVCLLDGTVVPYALAEGEDDGHGLAAGDLTEGHRFHAPGAFAVTSAADWADRLARHRVLVDAAERRTRIAHGIAAEAAARGLTVVEDPGLLDEVAGLVEWPVPLLGQIDPAFMDLPAEVMQVSMRVNQRYFALRDAAGAPAPWFGFVANIEAEDGGAVIVAGNERVLRARFADARHFWDLDRRTRLAARVAALDAITFHAKLGSQGDRVRRLRRLARAIAPLVGADPVPAERAAELAKADLVTGMVGEFPELQGVMGSYYARHDNEDPAVADAIRAHYAPRGPNDAVPEAAVSVAVALADKLDQLAGFFAIDEKPSGSGDPYALRRAALGVMRLIRENRLRLALLPLIATAGCAYADAGLAQAPGTEVLGFIIERLRVQLRTEGARHDVLAAVFAAGADDDLVRLLDRARAVAALLGTGDGANLLIAYRRAANILRIEAQKDGGIVGPVDPALLHMDEERTLWQDCGAVAEIIRHETAAERFAAAMSAMARLRAPLDAFFDRVTVNAAEPELRRNRLRLLAAVRDMMNQIADFSQIEG